MESSMLNSQSLSSKKIITKWIPTLLGIIVAAGMVVYIIHNDSLADLEVKDIRWGFAFLLLISRCLTWYISGLGLAFFVKEKGISLDFVETFGLSAASLLINKVTPVAGAMVVKSGYLKRRYKFPLSNYLALMVANSLMNYFVSGLLGLIVIVLISILPGFRFAWEGIPIMASVLVVPVIILVLPWKKLNVPDSNRIMHWINLAVQGWNEIRTNKPLLIKQFVTVVAIITSQAVSYMLTPLSLGQQTPALGMIFISILTNVTRVTPIRDFFGFTEFIAGLGTQMTGIGMETGLTAALMIRVVSIAASIIFGPIFIYILSKRLGEPLIAKTQINDN